MGVCDCVYLFANRKHEHNGIRQELDYLNVYMALYWHKNRLDDIYWRYLLLKIQQN